MFIVFPVTIIANRYHSSVHMGHGEGTQASKGDTSRRELAAGAGMRGAH